MSEILKDDRRARRSRRAMTDALFHLMQQHEWADLSVQMICDRADVARSTFYAHYQTRQDLLDDVFAAGEEHLADLSRAGGLEATLIWLADHLSGAAVFHRRLQGSTAGHAIMTRFRRQMRARFAEVLAAESHNISPRDLDFITGGVFSVLESWMQGGCREPTQPLVLHLVQLIRQCGLTC